MKTFRFAVAALMVGMLATMATAFEGDKEAPEFKAMTPDGKEISLSTVKAADVVVVVFTCNQCPVAVAYEDRFIDFNKQYKEKNVAFVAINNSSREDAEAMKQRIEEKGLNYAYAYDGSGDSAKAYGAKVTPTCYVLDKNRNVVYHGAFDDAWNGEPEKNYVNSVVDSLLKGEAPEYTETKAVGCGIKFKR